MAIARAGLASILACVAGVLAAPAVTTAQVGPPKITSLGQDTLTVAAIAGADTGKTYISVLNAGRAPVRIRVAFQASSSDKVRVASFVPHVATADSATRVGVTLSGLAALRDDPVEGQLVVTGGEVPVARAVSITPAPQPTLDWSTLILVVSGSFGVALILAVVLWAVHKHETNKLGGRAPGPKWSFDSWATTLTAAGAIFGTVLGQVTLPPVPREIDKDTLVQLNLLFGVLLAVGPFIFQAVRRPSEKPDDDLWGFSPILLLSYAITLTAVIGELAALTLLAWELTGGLWGDVLVVTGAGLMLLAAWYSWVTTYPQVTTDWTNEAQKAAEEARRLATEGQKVDVVNALGHKTWPNAPAPEAATESSPRGFSPIRQHARMP